MPDRIAPPDRIGMLRHLSPQQWKITSQEFDERRVHTAGEVISDRGVPLSHSLVLERGLVGRRILSGRQRVAKHYLVALQVPGDFVDLHAYPLGVLDHDIVAITDVTLAAIPHHRLSAIMAADQDLTRRLWSLTLVDAAIHRQWSLRNGTMRALQRVAHLFVELITRLDLAVGRAESYRLDLSQRHIGDACGLSSVHVNRILRDLREAGSCTYAKGVLVVTDRAALVQIAGFDDRYLYLPRV
ncbi:cAMP-binding domain of CRP or a regulatory subunit of cAMP-dependent protein kinases [Loktanella fryxellensis]|uniref:cAMP-binding domain of CRP or a regulatory subunit of cAMP-dependent protein kinases n=1 Tax=Loktanella fryxellensis TaxID=245187 RepID=A0A1H8H8C5_9RHOB|nr:Crp/Fnr family transcriptional regulator [Loktanella fryxellensis]SEN52483.1 cAMP-binding domain of CRP or a regulatory subunit of cAMP-dependent protein kinases [Loktanella fryxellensis]